jgi:hypothetical protein
LVAQLAEVDVVAEVGSIAISRDEVVGIEPGDSVAFGNGANGLM